MREYRIVFKVESIFSFEETLDIQGVEFYYPSNDLLARTTISASDAAEARALALEVMDRVCNSISFIVLYPIFFHISKIEEINIDSTIMSMEAIKASLVVRKKLTNQNIGTISQISNLAVENKKVEKVMQLINQPDFKSWHTLYKIYELIDSDTKLVKQGWITEKELRLFKQTANNPIASGLGARHGYQKTEPPKKPIELEEAVNLIVGIINNWTAYLIGEDNLIK